MQSVPSFAKPRQKEKLDIPDQLQRAQRDRFELSVNQIFAETAERAVKLVNSANKMADATI